MTLLYYYCLFIFINQLLCSSCIIQQPTQTYCDSNRLCKQCSNKNCKSCLLDLTSCDTCIENTYFYEQNCYLQQPSGALCNENKVCQKCSIENCISCKDGINTCSQCDQSNAKKYYYQNKCLESQPLNTTCDEQNVCSLSPCITEIQDCDNCDQAGNRCIACKSNLYLIDYQPPQKQKCVPQDQIPKNTFCTNFKCTECSTQCGQCQINNDKCTACSNILEYLFNYQCFTSQPASSYCDANIRKCQPCSADNCFDCSDNIDICKKCDQNTANIYLFQNKCIENKTINMNCDTNNICQELINCTTYFYENECFQTQPKSTYCQIENGIKVCQKCNSKCQECIGPSDNECTSCYPNSTLSNSICKVSALDYPSSISAEQVKQIENQVQATSSTSAMSSAVLSSSQNIISQSSFGLLISGIASQKIAQMILVNTDIPSPVFASLKSSFKQLPAQQMQSLNVITQLIPQSPLEINKYLNIKFEAIQLSYNIFQTCGSGILLFLICSLLFGVFYIAKEKITNKKINSIAHTLYSKVFSGFIVQYFQLIVSMFIIGINSQILEFIYEEHTEKLAAKIISLIILTLIVITILHQIYYYLNFQTAKTNKMTFLEITRDKILNETILESKLRRNYMLIMLLVESIIIPTTFIQFYFNSLVSSSLAIIFQLILFILTCILMPFHSKLTNGYFVVYSLLWLGLYIDYLIINIYSSKPNISDYSTILDNISWFFVIVIQIVILSNPIYMALTFISRFIDFIRQKIEERKLKQVNDQLIQASSIQQIEMNSSDIKLQNLSQNLILTTNYREKRLPSRNFNLRSQSIFQQIKKQN